MRIIAGAAKGRRLVAPDTEHTRPVTDRAREAVFSSLGAWVIGADVADLYAGSGSFGLEALSRGAGSAVFVEKAQPALAALRKNVETLGLGGEVVAADVGRYLEGCTRTFDLVFIDPPWEMSSLDLGADLASLDACLGEDAEVVASRRHTDDVPRIPESWRVATEKRYGDTRILRYEKKVPRQ